MEMEGKETFNFKELQPDVAINGYLVFDVPQKAKGFTFGIDYDNEIGFITLGKIPELGF
jgi:hypothetical protein